MVQKEVRHKTKLYTVAAVLLALVLVSSIYVATMSASANFGMYGPTGVSTLKTFASTNELKNYLLTNTQNGIGYSAGYSRNVGDSIGGAPLASVDSGMGVTTSSGDYSLTNVQVAGVDEADVVKTDGQYIYALINTVVLPASIQIVKADSNDLSVVGKIEFSNLHIPDGMYLSENGNKLTVLGQYYPKGEDVESFIYVYDVSNRAKPTLTRKVTFSGYYSNSRMIGDYVYAVISQPAYVDNGHVFLPKIRVGAVTKDIDSTCIYYTEIQDRSFSYTTFIGFNLIDDTEQLTSITILMGASSCMYVSTNNMYVTFPDTEGNTEIYRLAINGVNLTFEAQGITPGYVLNQYSMDEYNNYFRITTTVSTGLWRNSEDQHNNLYVLDMDLNKVGKIENLAQGERIYATRFIGNKAYLVTFKQVDPFFILDLKDPTAPKITGELKIPGVSNYLHPYNENYIIGIGREDGHFVKLSLFNVTDMKNPTEIAKYIINENPAVSSYSSVNAPPNLLSSHSNAIFNPKAFLFNPQKQLLILPISTYSTIHSWQGIYAFKVSPENGFSLQKEIAHQLPSPTNSNNNIPDQMMNSTTLPLPILPTVPFDNNRPLYQPITRSIYIGNILYTISDYKIQLNSLGNYELITQLVF